MNKITAELANAEVFDPEGAPHRLGELWQSKAAVLVFLRHFA
jgi:hypothetical protein